ncbi:Hypothetical_protein [Hexamita inflata]|uniref:Hypothetical_protein n=1 Tax=Hexamita inflata TaxID=28002 RepID=A0AA86QYJ5_9EUKA|nr:Hypothetical protein HINF_LOCUS53307 [Hexamita inflata]
MRPGQIGCGRQNPPVQSAELASSRIGMAKGMPSTSLQDWKAATAPLLPQKRRWYDAGGLPYRSACTKQPRYAPGCLYPSRWLPWLRRCAQRTQVCLKLMIIRVNLQFLYRRPNQYKRKLSEWDIQTKKDPRYLIKLIKATISKQCQYNIQFESSNTKIIGLNGILRYLCINSYVRDRTIFCSLFIKLVNIFRAIPLFQPTTVELGSNNIC